MIILLTSPSNSCCELCEQKVCLEIFSLTKHPRKSILSARPGHSLTSSSGLNADRSYEKRKFVGKFFFLSVLGFLLSSDLLHKNLCTFNLNNNEGGKRKHGNVILHFTQAFEWEISARAKPDLLSCQSTGLAPTEPDHDQISLVETLCLSGRMLRPKPLT